MKNGIIIKEIMAIILAVLVAFGTACSNGKKFSDIPAGTAGNPLRNACASLMPEVIFPTDPKEGSRSDADVSINLNRDSISVEGKGTEVSGSTVTITAAGTYLISGTLNDGQIIVNTKDEEKVKLVFNGVKVKCSYSSPVYIISAPKKVIAYLQEGSVNILEDSSEYDESKADPVIDAPSAAIFSMDDLKLDGKGELYVTGNYNKGIYTKDDLEIESGRIYVKAVDDGMRGKNSITVTGGFVYIDAGEDGLRTSNETDEDKGNLRIDGGTIYIKAEQDGVESDRNVMIAGGTLCISAGDDGIHGNESLEINGGTIDIVKSYEGLEALNITISGGTNRISATDDGINAAGGADSSSMGGKHGPNSFASHDTGMLTITGGYTMANAAGDGVDSNGDIEMSNGTLIVYGPTDSGNGALDYNGVFNLTGGYLLAVDSTGMAQSVTSSRQGVMSFTLDMEGDTLLHIQDSSGNEVLTVRAPKSYSSVVFSSPSLKSGETYTVYYGGSYSADGIDGIYSGGQYFGGTKLGNLQI